jgi:hypothetical protein
MAGSALEKLKSVGANIVEGIKTGIFNAWSGFTTWMMNLLGTMIDAIKAYFGIKSPSTVMAALAEQLPAGLRVGWQSAFPGLLAAVKANLGEMVAATQERVSQIMDLIDRVSKYGSATGGNSSGNNDYQPGTGGGGGRGTGQARASGGPVMTGMTYLVGEQGPELFVPSSGGTIIPNGALAGVGSGGQTTLNLTIPIYVNDTLVDTQELSINLQGRKELTSASQRVLS